MRSGQNVQGLKNLRLILKRYGLPLVITLVVYTLLYLFSGKGAAYFNVGFFTAIAYALLMRFTDDILDYEKDVVADKAPIKRHILIFGVVVSVVLVVLLTVFSAFWWLLLPLVLVSLLFIVKGVAADLLKMLFTPTVIVALTISVFNFNVWVWILAAVVFILDGILIYKRRK